VDENQNLSNVFVLPENLLVGSVISHNALNAS